MRWKRLAELQTRELAVTWVWQCHRKVTMADELKDSGASSKLLMAMQIRHSHDGERMVKLLTLATGESGGVHAKPV